MDWLSEQCRRIQEQKLKQEKTIKCLKQLFKAWPSKAESEEVRPEQQSASAGKASEQCQVGDANSLTAEEKEGLLLMDQLLSKAQKARDIQKKLEEPKKSRKAEIGQHKTKNDSNIHKNEKSVDSNDKKGPQSNIVENTRVDRSNKQLSEKVLHTNTDVKNKSVRTLKPQGKGLITSSSKSVEKSERTRTSHRPQSSSGSRKVVPVHASAPFQTNPHLASAKLQTTYRAATAKTLAKSRGASSAGSKVKEGKRTVQEGTIVSRFRSLKTDDGKTNEADLSEVDQEINDNSKIRAGKDCGNKSAANNIESVSDMYSSESVNDKCNNDVDSVQGDCLADNPGKTTGRDCQEVKEKHLYKLFNLNKDGSTLSVPNKLKKLLYQNRKLRQKLYTQNVTQKVNSPRASAEFPEHLQNTSGDEDAQLTQLQAKQAQHITQTYTSLLHMLDSLHMEHLSADSDLADIYYSKKMVEYILLSFQKMEQNLHTTDFRKLGAAVIHRDGPSIKLPLAEPSSLSVWYGKYTEKGGHSRAPVYRYASYEQLQRYMDTVYQVQLLQLQIDVMDTVARLLLPLLQTLDPDTSEFAQVLRAGYSLMSVNRNHMPVVVMDTIQDDSALHNEED
ncbi:uncharacterized protein LOC128555190 isoform X2 [Mercenaria mercenaria]|uniref:uncharacterized protein LOC128555190 isoform X2 n=1 Tax=Mercenaria mercenaria TaxID=6596 RepID=UPI00234E9766|nr:uncharacterized protein LOC128555190 isoform X2 [Mercenaria mercenaria]